MGYSRPMSGTFKITGLGGLRDFTANKGHRRGKHGSWLNMAEIELNVLTRQCLNRRIADIETIKKEVAAWQKFRNNKIATVNWQFTTEDARVKLRRLYPTLES